MLWCAVSRDLISPTQSGRIWKEILGSSCLPGVETHRGKDVNHKIPWQWNICLQTLYQKPLGLYLCSVYLTLCVGSIDDRPHCLHTKYNIPRELDRRRELACKPL